MLKLEPYLKKCVIVNVWNIHHNIASCAGIRNPAFNPHGPRTCAGMFAIGLLDRQFAPRAACFRVTYIIVGSRGGRAVVRVARF